MKPACSMRRRRGVSLIEFALCAILFFMFFFGIMSWAWVFYQHQTITWRVSDAARWAAANFASDNNTTIQNIVICGAETCSGQPNPFYSVGNIVVDHFSVSDQIYDYAQPVTRYFVRVTVQNYTFRHFIPGFSVTGSGRPISAVQPMECQDSGGNCRNWN